MPGNGEAAQGVVDVAPQLPGQVVAGLGLRIEHDAGAQRLAAALVGHGHHVDGGQHALLGLALVAAGGDGERPEWGWSPLLPLP